VQISLDAQGRGGAPTGDGDGFILQVHNGVEPVPGHEDDIPCLPPRHPLFHLSVALETGAEHDNYLRGPPPSTHLLHTVPALAEPSRRVGRGPVQPRGHPIAVLPSIPAPAAATT
jgi:hypothetical protein